MDMRYDGGCVYEKTRKRASNSVRVDLINENHSVKSARTYKQTMRASLTNIARLPKRFLDERGTNFWEVILTIVIIGILSTVIMFKLLGTTNDARISVATSELSDLVTVENAATEGNASGLFDTGTQLVADLTNSEPELAARISTDTPPASFSLATTGTIYIGNSTANDFTISEYTSNGTEVTANDPTNGATTITTN
jgi:type II secretory pathway pseudopilin PulG